MSGGLDFWDCFPKMPAFHKKYLVILTKNKSKLKPCQIYDPHTLHCSYRHHCSYGSKYSLNASNICTCRTVNSGGISVCWWAEHTWASQHFNEKLALICLLGVYLHVVSGPGRCVWVQEWIQLSAVIRVYTIFVGNNPGLQGYVTFLHPLSCFTLVV